MNEKYLQLNDIDAYKIAFKLSNYVWDVVAEWDYFAKDTIGKQFVRATDSISANIAEGFGRYTKKDKVRFNRIANGSIKESLDWNEKSKVRNIISDKNYGYVYNILQQLPKKINQLIKYTNNVLKE